MNYYNFEFDCLFNFFVNYCEIILYSSSSFISDEVSSLSKILMFYFYEQKATDLQSRLDNLLILIVKHKAEIWTSENNNNNTDANFEYGPGATVQTILEQRSSTVNLQNKSKFYMKD